MAFYQYPCRATPPGCVCVVMEDTHLHRATCVCVCERQMCENGRDGLWGGGGGVSTPWFVHLSSRPSDLWPQCCWSYLHWRLLGGPSDLILDWLPLMGGRGSTLDLSLINQLR